MFDFDKLFEVGNVICVNSMTMTSNNYHIEVVTEQNQAGWKKKYNTDYVNDRMNFIQYIIRLDENGNVAERVFDRRRDIFPKLETGMFIMVKNEIDGETTLGVVVKDRFIFENGNFDFVKDYKDRGRFGSIVITKVWDCNAYCFNAIRDGVEPIWVRP